MNKLNRRKKKEAMKAKTQMPPNPYKIPLKELHIVNN